METLILEAKGYYQEWGALPVHTIFMGGGTPSLIPMNLIERWGELLAYFDVSRLVEWTIEMNPVDTPWEGLEKWLKWGVNRISVGVQSVVDADLQFLERDHPASTAQYCIQWLLDQGIHSVNADVIYALPRQSLDSLSLTIESLVAWGVTHLSTYALTIEQGTPFAKQSIIPADESTELSHSNCIQSILHEAGFEHYEISAFARPGHRCRHNQTYWTDQPYIGLGPSAHSYFMLRDYANPSRLDYLQRGLGFNHAEPLSPTDHYQRLILTGLRTKEGVSMASVHQKTGVDMAMFPQLHTLIQHGLLNQENGWIRATPRGWNVLNGVIGQLV